MQAQIMDALKEAMNARDSVRLSALRAIKSALKNQEIDQGAALSDTDCLKVIRSQAKQAKTIAGFEAAGRGDEADEARAQRSRDGDLPPPGDESRRDLISGRRGCRIR